MSAKCPRPFFSYYGAKFRLGPTYPHPEHGRIVEPFAGAAGYSVHHASHEVLLCDLNPRVIGVWNYLIRVTESELLALPDVPDGTNTRDLDLPQEAKWLIGWWLDAGERYPRNTPSKWMRERRGTAQFWGPQLRLALSRQLHLIRHWQVVQCDYREAPVTGRATWFVDPPYQGKPGERYPHGSDRIDFDALGRWCQEREGQVIACEQSGAKWLPFRRHATTNGLMRRSTEVVWTKPGPHQVELTFQQAVCR